MAGIMGRKGSKKYNRNVGCLTLVGLMVLGLAWCGDGGKKKHRRAHRAAPVQVEKAAAPEPAGPRYNDPMTVNQDVAVFATREQAAVFESYRAEGDREMAKWYGEKCFNDGNSCLMKRGEQVRVFEVSTGGAWIRVRREGSMDAWWVDARALYAADDDE